MKLERCVNASFVPRRLLEQLPDEQFSPDNFYSFMDIALQSPNQLLFILLSDTNEIIGFLWCEINMLEKILFVNILSVNKELWHVGNTVKFTVDFLKELFDKLELHKVLWISDRPALFEKMGFLRSKNILLEYSGEEK